MPIIETRKTVASEVGSLSGVIILGRLLVLAIVRNGPELARWRFKRFRSEYRTS